MKLRIKNIFIVVLSFLVVLNVYKFIRNRERESVYDIDDLRRNVDTILGLKEQEKEASYFANNDNARNENGNNEFIEQMNVEEYNENENALVEDKSENLDKEEDTGNYPDKLKENSDNQGEEDYKDNEEETDDPGNVDDKVGDKEKGDISKEEVVDYKEKTEETDDQGDIDDTMDDKEHGDISEEEIEEEEEKREPKRLRPPQDESSTTKDEQTTNNHTKYHGHDLLQDPKFRFHPNYKNPCWYGENNYGKRTLRCLPYFFIIGVKKCGTSDLFYRITQHPDVVKPGFKEAQFFARSRFRSEDYDDINYYVDKFDPAAQEILNRTRVDGEGHKYNHITITGEASPSNLHLNSHWKYLPGNENMEEPKFVHLDYIHHFLPTAKIIITFRDPVERLYSDYYHEYGSLMKHNDPNPHQFHDIVTEGIALYRSCFAVRTVRSCVYDQTLYAKTKIQIQLGIFYIFWEDLVRLYPRDSILVLQNKNLKDKETTLTNVFKHLGLRTPSEEEWSEIADRPPVYSRKEAYKLQGPMLNETCDLLAQFYRPFNVKMADIVGDTDFLYTNSK